MASVLIKNLPDQLHQQLKLRAQRHHHSLNKELIALIEMAVGEDNLESREAQDPQAQRQLAQPRGVGSAASVPVDRLRIALTVALAWRSGMPVLTSDHHEFDNIVERALCEVQFFR